MKIMTIFVEFIDVIDDLSIVKNIDDLYIDKIFVFSIEKNVIVIMKFFEQKYNCFINHTSIVTSFKRNFNIFNLLFRNFTNFIVFNRSFDMIFLHVRFENRHDNSFDNSMYNTFVNFNSMNDNLQIAVIVINFETFQNNENLTFHENLFSMIIVLKNKLMLQTFHQTIECKEIDANFLTKQFRTMFETIQNHVKIHDNLEYKSKNVEISKLIYVFHDFQHFLRVFFFHEIFRRLRKIEKIQIFCERIDKIDEKTRNQQNLNVQFEISFNHDVYLKEMICKRSQNNNNN